MSTVAALPITVPDEVLSYCQSHQLTTGFESAVRIAEQEFAPVLAWTISLEPDPEADETYLVIDIVVSGTVDEILRKRRQFTRRWANTATPNASWHIRVLTEIQ